MSFCWLFSIYFFTVNMNIIILFIIFWVFSFEINWNNYNNIQNINHIVHRKAIFNTNKSLNNCWVYSAYKFIIIATLVFCYHNYITYFIMFLSFYILTYYQKYVIFSINIMKLNSLKRVYYTCVLNRSNKTKKYWLV